VIQLPISVYPSTDDKYAAEEKVVIEDEITKTVTERRMEIEQRLTGEPVIIEKKQEPFVATKDDVDRRVTSKEVPIESIEPTEVSFEHKRMSFERGVSIEQVLQEDIPVKEKPIISEEKKMPSIEEQSANEEVVDATSLTFHEKRLSFEQGIPVKEIIQKKAEEIIPASEHNIVISEQQNEPTLFVNETKKLSTQKEITSTEGNRIFFKYLNSLLIIEPKVCKYCFQNTINVCNRSLSYFCEKKYTLFKIKVNCFQSS